MNLSKVSISDHALQMFGQRWRQVHHKNVYEPVKLIKKYLLDAKEVPPLSSASKNKKKKKRGKKNRQCRLFCIDGWCFVISDNMKDVVTIYRRK